MDINLEKKSEERSDVEEVLRTKSGRAFVWRMISLCGVYKDINVEGTAEIGRKLGQRSIGLLLMQIIGDVSQDKLFEMMEEAKEKEEEINRLLDRQEEREKREDAGEESVTNKFI